jgi:hypothetical protein
MGDPKAVDYASEIKQALVAPLPEKPQNEVKEDAGAAIADSVETLKLSEDGSAATTAQPAHVFTLDEDF